MTKGTIMVVLRCVLWSKYNKIQDIEYNASFFGSVADDVMLRLQSFVPRVPGSTAYSHLTASVLFSL